MSSLRSPKVIRYDLKIDELNKTIAYRALNVGEQKTLLTVLEFKDANAIVNSLVDIVDACTFKELDLSSLPMHIVDYIFLHIYVKSVGNMTQAEFTCGGEKSQDVTDEEGNVTGTEIVPCEAVHLVGINLDRAVLKYPEDYKPSELIDAGDGMMIKLRLPSFEIFKKLDTQKSWMDVSDQYIYSGIECVVDGEDVKTPGVDFNFSDLIEWINTLDASVLEKIEAYFKEAPTLFLEVPVTCPTCGRKEVFELTALEDFFV